MARQESPAQREQIDDMLHERGWEWTAEFAAYCCQDARLKLRPWQTPPCWIRGDPNEVLADFSNPRVTDLSGVRRAALLVKKLLENNLSRFEPDVIGAIERVSKAKDRKSTRLNSSHLGISYA